MNALWWRKSGEVAVEPGPRKVRLRHGDRVREWALERGPGGALTAECRNRLVSEVTAWLGLKPWQAKPKAWCLLSGAGVSLRRWKLPAPPAGGSLADVVRLQIEAEFPVPPEELAWGWVELGRQQAGGGGARDILVVALKRALVDDLAGWLEAAGLLPVFGLGALARLGILRSPVEACAILEIGREQSELLVLDEHGPSRLRLMPWGEESLIAALAGGLGLEPQAVGRWLEERIAGSAAPLVEEGTLTPVLDQALAPLVTAILAGRPVGRLYLTGERALFPAFVEALRGKLGPGLPVEVLLQTLGEGVSTSLHGLGMLMSTDRLASMPLIRTQAPEQASVLSRPAPRRWAVRVGAVLLAILALPYLEAFLLQPRLAARVASVKAKQDRMRIIDREADFLRYLKQNQLAHLDTLLVLGKSAPPGARIDSLNLNRKGELALRISMRQPPEVVAFRNKLEDSGFFSSVVLEEQSPTPDRQKILVRIAAQLKPAADRASLKILSSNDVPAVGGGGGMPGGPGMPMGMPVGMPVGMPGPG